MRACIHTYYVFTRAHVCAFFYVHYDQYYFNDHRLKTTVAASKFYCLISKGQDVVPLINVCVFGISREKFVHSKIK